MRYLITHGLRNGGANPVHTIEGRAQISNIVLPLGISKVVIGTGARFKEIHDYLVACGRLGVNVPCVFSPFCGSADGLEKGTRVVMVDGQECDLATEYIGLTDPASFNAWGFIASQPEGTLFCAGGELMTALTGGVGEKGRLYELDIDTKTATLLP